MPTISHAKHIRKFVARVFRDEYAALLSRHAVWCRSQGKEEAEIFASLVRARRRLDCQIDLTQLRKLARWANRQPARAKLRELRDPVEVFITRQIVDQVWALVPLLTWRDVFGLHCRLVFLKDLDTMGKTGKLTVDRDCRTGGEEVRLSKSTVAVCRRALCGLRVRQKTIVPRLLIRQVHDRFSEPERANSYTLRPLQQIGVSVFFLKNHTLRAIPKIRT